MYTKRPTQQNGEPLRLPEHYSGVAFSRQEPTVLPSEDEKEQTDITPDNTEQNKEECESKEDDCKNEEKSDVQQRKQNSLLGIGGREDILLLILALLLLDDEGGDDMLAYILLGLLFLG